MDRATSYKQRLEALAEEVAHLSTKDKRLSIIRFVLFVGLIAIIILSFQWKILILTILIIYGGIYGFYRLIMYHNTIRYQLDLKQKLTQLNQAEVAALQNDYSYFDAGVEFVNPNHEYTTDLDIFGKKSLYQKLNRCGSQAGKEALAQFFLKNIPFQDLPLYQDANQELAPQIDFRQNLFANGSLADTDPQHLVDLKAWIKDSNSLSTPLFVLILLPILCLVACGLIMYWQPLGEINMLTGLIYFVIAYAPILILNKNNKKKIDKIHNSLSKNSKHLKVYGRLIQVIEGQRFTSQKLITLQSIFTGEIDASKRINKLAYYSSQLDLRYNFFGIFFNILFLWDHIYVYLIQRWKDKNDNHLLPWFANLGEIEAINSTATLAYNHPNWIYPVFSDQYSYTGTALGHPLLPDNTRVCNDFDMNTKASIMIVTGSNMGGKSTFLRTVGINTVLAYLGTVTCSKSMQLPDIQIITSMRTIDDLSESTSSFYAELKRLKVVLDAVIRGENVFFLLDEILKGTNSNDRHNGAKALIMQLLRHQGAGLISTHDLELGILAEQHSDMIQNKCFEVETQGSNLVFDYLLKDGVSKSFNATELMRSMGIDI